MAVDDGHYKFILTAEKFSMKTEIRFHSIFQEKDPLKSLHDIFPEG